MNSSRTSLARGSMMIAASLLTAGTLSLITSVILARSVGVVEFGIYSITISLQGIMIMFAVFRIDAAVAKFVAEFNVRDARLALNIAKAGFKVVLLFSAVIVIIYLALAKPIGSWLYNEPRIAHLVPFSAMVVISSAVSAIASGFVQGNQRMKMLSLMQISMPAISLVVIVVLLPYFGVVAAFIGSFVGQTTIAISAVLWLGRTGFHVGRRTKDEVNEDCNRILFSFAVPAVASSVIVIPLYWYGNTLLALESGFLAVGQFAVAMVLFQALSILSNAVAIPLVPMVSAMTVGSKEHIESLISRSLRVVSFLFFPIFFAAALFSGEIVRILYGSGYNDSVGPAYLMVTTAYYFAIATTVGAAIVGLGRMWIGLGLWVLWGIVFLASVLIFTPLLGPTGLGLAFCLSYGVHLVNCVAVSDRFLKVKIRNLSLVVLTSVVLFATGFVSTEEYGGISFMLRVALLAVGTAIVLYLGRREFRLVLDRVLTR